MSRRLLVLLVLAAVGALSWLMAEDRSDSGQRHVEEDSAAGEEEGVLLRGRARPALPHGAGSEGRGIGDEGKRRAEEGAPTSVPDGGAVLTARFRGDVRGPDGRPAGHVRLYLEGAAGRFELTTDAAGRFDRPVPLGQYAATLVGPDGGALHLATLVLDAASADGAALSLALLSTVGVEVLVLRPQAPEEGSKEKTIWIPAVGAEVSFTNKQAPRLSQETMAGGEGVALFEGLLPVGHAVEVRLPDAVALRYVAEVTLGEQQRLTVRMPERVPLKGKVSAGVDGAGVSGAILTMTHAAGEESGVFETTLTSLYDGTFEGLVPPAHAQAVEVSAPGFAPWPSTPMARVAALGVLNRVAGPGAKPLHVVLEAGILVRGSFVPADDVALPPEGLAFSFVAGSQPTVPCQSDADGTFEVAALGTGRWGIEFRTPGWRAAGFHMLRLRAAMGPVYEYPAILVTRASGLRGRVLDVAGRPAAGAHVAVFPSSAGQPAGTFTDELGRWILPDTFGPGVGHVRATLGTLVTRAVAIPRGGEVALDLRLLATGRISGRVQDTDTGEGVSAVLLRFSPADSHDPTRRTERTDATGAFTALGLLPGTWHVAIERVGYRPHATIDMDVALEKPVELALQLDPGVVFAGRFVDEQGAPLPGTKIHVSGTDTNGWTVRRTVNTDGEGLFRAGGMPEGVYVLRALREGYKPFVKPQLSRGDERMRIVLQKKTAPAR